jgi:hypothetical protein
MPPPSNNQTANPSTDNFTAIFNAALNEYQAVTGNRLDVHPFANQLNTCNSPEAVSNVLRDHTRAFSRFRNGDKSLMTWLDPIVHILFTFSGTLGEGIGLVSRLVDALHPMRPSSDIWFSAFLSRKSNLYRNRRSSRGMCPPKCLVVCSWKIRISGREECRREPRHACQPL